ncbi:MAG: zinc ribbon domain-containing protein [Chloroflexi bacterium]|nr:zinc ribbon domain-containing protein [Chloroflexota bacterium]
MWRLGPVLALSLLPQLVICLVLLVGVIAVRQVVKGVTKGGALQTQVAKGVAQDTLSRGQAVVEREVEQAKSSLSALAQDVKADLGRVIGEQTATSTPVPPVAPRCPSCGRFVRAGAKFCDGCGAALLATCPHCGRALRPGAKFCDGCGKPIRPVA